MRLAPLTPLPTILSKANLVLCCPPKNCFVTPYTIFMVLGTPTLCSISYRLRGSPSRFTPHFRISNYAASASPFWKSTGSHRFPNTLSGWTEVYLSNSRVNGSDCCCCCCLHIKSRSDLYSVLSNIRTGPTGANAFRGHRLTTQKGYTYQKYIKGPRKVNTHAIIGK